MNTIPSVLMSFTSPSSACCLDGDTIRSAGAAGKARRSRLTRRG
jgi:hypothetical protein